MLLGCPTFNFWLKAWMQRLNKIAKQVEGQIACGSFAANSRMVQKTPC